MSDDLTIPNPTYRVPRHARGMEPGTRKLALIAAGIGGFLILAGGGWHIVSHRHAGVPVVQADPGPIRVKPANPGGLQVAGANNDIFSGGSDTTDAKLAPPPQTPDPQALKAMEVPKPAAPPVVVPQPVMNPPAALAAVPAPAPVQAAREAPTAPVAPAEPPPAVQTAAQAPAVHPADRPAATAAARVAPGGKDVQVQFAALSSEQAAHEEWDRLMRRWPDLLHGHQPSFTRIDRDGHVFWRVRASGFEGRPDAAVFCERVRAKGGGCSVADF